MELEEAPFALRECVDGAVALIRSLASGKGLAFTCEYGDGRPEVVVGDVTRLRQILLNVLNNSVKFTEAGTVALTVKREGGGEDGRRRLHLAVRDTGIGIAAEHIDRLFQPFSQSDASITRRFGGTGLGLAISKRLAEATGGTMRLDEDSEARCARWCNGGMDSDKPSMLRRLVAAVVLLVVAVLAIRIAIGFVVGVVSAVIWIVVVAALVVAALWARSTLKSTRRERRVKRSSAPAVSAPPEDPVAVEMRRITEQLREQGRR